MFSKLKRNIVNHIREKYLFKVRMRERVCRQAFFFNAFKALTFNGIDGDYVEFGSHGGLTFSLAHRESRRHGHAARLWSFDSFEGLPAQQSDKDEHPEWVEGAMSTSLEKFHKKCAKSGIPREDYEVVPGFYEDTLPPIAAAESPRNIALAYVDCDLYSSTQTVLAFLEPRLKHGMIVAFDDYFCWSATQISGERRAMLDCFGDESPWHLEPYVQFGWHGQSFIVERKAAAAS